MDGLRGPQLGYICNASTPQIKGICCGLNVMYQYHIFPGVLQLSGVIQLPLECATTSYQNAHNYATTTNGMLQKYQGALIQIPKTSLLIKHNNYINTDCGFELRC